jgi:hypothetical protein
LDHPALVLNVPGCTHLDSDGVLALLHAFKRLRDQGRRMVVVAEGGRAATLLRSVGLHHVVPLFADEESAVLALRGGPPLTSPANWEEARVETIRYWKDLAEALEHAPAENILRVLTSMTPLCERSDQLYRMSAAAAWNRAAEVWGAETDHEVLDTRCWFCPLFHRLVCGSEDLGCHGILDPLIKVVQEGDRTSACAQVAAVIRTIEQMPVPPDHELPI